MPTEFRHWMLTSIRLNSTVLLLESKLFGPTAVLKVLGRTLCQRKNPTILDQPIPTFFRLTPLAY
jgi:hypothetical protein